MWPHHPEQCLAPPGLHPVTSHVIAAFRETTGCYLWSERVWWTVESDRPRFESRLSLFIAAKTWIRSVR